MSLDQKEKVKILCQKEQEEEKGIDHVSSSSSWDMNLFQSRCGDLIGTTPGSVETLAF